MTVIREYDSSSSYFFPLYIFFFLLLFFSSPFPLVFSLGQKLGSRLIDDEVARDGNLY